MYDGKEHRGLEQIRAALAPQYENAFGRLTFNLEELLIDEENQSAAVCWTCQHDLHRLFHYCSHPAPVALVVRTLYGATFAWQGLDILHFDGPLLKAKMTYSKTHLPMGKSDIADEHQAEQPIALST